MLVNGLPLAFIEVKKPNNRDDIIAEHTRITERFAAHMLPGCTKRKLLENECRELAKLRDWLLPMLMNGSICFNLDKSLNDYLTIKIYLSTF